MANQQTEAERESRLATEGTEVVRERVQGMLLEGIITFGEVRRNYGRIMKAAGSNTTAAIPMWADPRVRTARAALMSSIERLVVSYLDGEGVKGTGERLGARDRVRHEVIDAMDDLIVAARLSVEV